MIVTGFLIKQSAIGIFLKSTIWKKLRQCIWNIRCFIQPFYGLDEMICVSINIGLFWLIEHLIKQKKIT